MVGEKLVQSIAKFAADDEQDALVFKMLSGPENASLSANGELVYTPEVKKLDSLKLLSKFPTKEALVGMRFSLEWLLVKTLVHIG